MTKNVVPENEAKQIMLEILKEVASFCDKNGLLYYLAYGTLIGAIRHNGFIPWDDDIDIMMPRPDYEKFVELYHKNGKYSISSPLVDKGCFLIYSKVYDERTVKYEEGIDYNRFPALGIDIDVFPLDGIPCGAHFSQYIKDRDRFMKLGKLILRVITPRRSYPTLRSKLSSFILNPICKLIGKDFFIRKAIQLMSQYKYEESDYVHVAFHHKSSLNERYDKKDFSDRVKVTFEKELFWAPKGYDSVLKSFYGDYMQLPPISERQTHHRNNVYWRD